MISVPINPLGPPSMAIKALQAGTNMVQHYPDPDARGLMIKSSRHLNVPPENLLPDNGGAEIIYALGRSLKPGRLVLPVPTFSEYRTAFGKIPTKSIPLDPRNNFALLVGLLAETMHPGDVIFICNPNNPTGYLVNRIDQNCCNWQNGRRKQEPSWW